MKKSVWFVVFLMVGLLLLAGCGPSVSDAKAQFCNDWKELGAAIAKAKALDGNATVKQAKDAQKEIAQAWEKASKSAAALKEVQINATKQAYEAMTKAIDSIPEEATLGQASAGVQAAVTGFDTAVTAINTTVCVAK